MKNSMLLFLLLVSINLAAQQKLFHTYSDSVKLITDANEIVTDFFIKVRKTDASVNLLLKATLNTQARQVFYSSENNTINLSLWPQLNPEQKIFFTRLANGDEKEGKKNFGLFFNGFSIILESGQAIQTAKEKNNPNKYQRSLFANTVAILYLRESAYKKQLEKCYSYVNSVLQVLADPVPAGENEEDYFNKNYDRLLLEPDKYYYFQFNNFKKIYEDKALPGFAAYLKNYSSR
jgi:hypothetical protein